MRSVYRAIMAAICAFLTGCAVAQSVSTNGTMLADDLTSRSRVVVDAFANSSNKVHDLIQNVSPAPDLSFSNDFVRCSMLTNEVCAIVTNEYLSSWTYEGLPDGAVVSTSPEPQETSWFFAFGYSNEVYIGTGYYSSFPSNSNIVVFYNCYSMLSTNRYNVTATRYRQNNLGLMTDNRFYSTITGEVSGIVTNVSADWSCELGTLEKRSSNFWRGYWEGVFIELSYEESYWTITSDGGYVLTETVEGSADATYIRFELDEGSEAATALGTTSIELVRGNALGLARISDIEPSISNTVTKAYIEDLGIESGVDAQTVTNMTALTPVYSQTPTFTEWTFSGTAPSMGRYQLQYESGIWTLRDVPEGGDFMDGLFQGEDLGTADATSLHFVNDLFGPSDVTATRTRTDIIGYTLGTQTNSVLVATNSLISASTATNIASTVSADAIANADTTYRRMIGLTNLNQSVQYVNITDPAPTTLAISMPTDGATKDWMVYVVSVTNVTLSLPAATWWMADAAYTNDIPPATPTAFWFSQVTDGIFILGRQELTEVTAP